MSNNEATSSSIDFTEALKRYMRIEHPMLPFFNKDGNYIRAANGFYKLAEHKSGIVALLFAWQRTQFKQPFGENDKLYVIAARGSAADKSWVIPAIIQHQHQLTEGIKREATLFRIGKKKFGNPCAAYEVKVTGKNNNQKNYQIKISTSNNIYNGSFLDSKFSVSIDNSNYTNDPSGNLYAYMTAVVSRDFSQRTLFIMEGKGFAKDIKEVLAEKASDKIIIVKNTSIPILLLQATRTTLKAVSVAENVATFLEYVEKNSKKITDALVDQYADAAVDKAIDEALDELNQLGLYEIADLLRKDPLKKVVFSLGQALQKSDADKLKSFEYMRSQRCLEYLPDNMPIDDQNSSSWSREWLLSSLQGRIGSVVDVREEQVITVRDPFGLVFYHFPKCRKVYVRYNSSWQNEKFDPLPKSVQDLVGRGGVVEITRDKVGQLIENHLSEKQFIRALVLEVLANSVRDWKTNLSLLASWMLNDKNPLISKIVKDALTVARGIYELNLKNPVHPYQKE